MNFLEDGSSLTALVPSAYASIGSDYSKRTPSTKGDTLGILLSNTGTTLNQPVQESYNVSSFTGVDVVNTATGYAAVFDDGESINGTGVILKKVEIVNTMVTSGKTDFYTTDIMNGSLVGHWDMEALTSDGKLKDMSGNSNNSTAIGGVTIGGALGNPKNGNASSFNGTSNYVSIGNSSSLNNGSGDFTINLWMKSSASATSNDGMLFKGPGGFNNGGIGWDLRARGNGATIEFCVNGGGICPRIGGTLKQYSWNHVVIVVSRSNATSSLYINGVFQSSMNYAPVYTDTYSLTIGRGFDTYFPGTIDEIRIYNRALSSTEITSFYNATK